MQQTIEKFPGAEAHGWQLYHTVAPHRSVNGPLVFGLVWRQRREGRWIYMQADEQVRAAVELVNAAHRSRRSRRLRKL